MTSPVKIDRIDHIVLTVKDIDATCAFYEKTLGMTRETFAGGRTALSFGRQKINLHPAAEPYDPHAGNPVSGGADFCMITETPIETVQAHLEACGVEIMFGGPTPKTGATGPITSVYFRDPDENLVEVSNYD